MSTLRVMLCGRSVLWWGGVWHAWWIFIGTSLPHTLKDQRNTWLQEDKNPWCLCLFSTLNSVCTCHAVPQPHSFLWSFVEFQTPWIEWLRSFLMEKSKLFNWIPPSHDLLICSAVYQTHLLQPPPPQNCYHLNPHLTRHGFTVHRGSPVTTLFGPHLNHHRHHPPDCPAHCSQPSLWSIDSPLGPDFWVGKPGHW